MNQRESYSWTGNMSFLSKQSNTRSGIDKRSSRIEVTDEDGEFEATKKFLLNSAVKFKLSCSFQVRTPSDLSSHSLLGLSKCSYKYTWVRERGRAVNEQTSKFYFPLSLY